MGLEPARLVALVLGRRGSPLIVSAFFITYKMNIAESGSVGSGEVSQICRERTRFSSQKMGSEVTRAV